MSLYETRTIRGVLYFTNSAHTNVPYRGINLEIHKRTLIALVGWRFL